MIYYFSAEGNSEFVARRLDQMLADKAVRVTDANLPEPLPGDGVGLVFPVHGWGVPLPMLRFIRDHADILRGTDYVWCCMTCGDDCGLTHEQLARELDAAGCTLSAAYSVTMPNTYLLLPGFALDPDSLVCRKLRESLRVIERAASGIKARANEILVKKGALPWLKSRVLYPLFAKYSPKGRKWRCDRDLCVKCGLCVANCPQKNVTPDAEGYPCWGDDCISCLGCYHNCPKRAIDYGRVTRRHKQYNFNIGTSILKKQ